MLQFILVGIGIYILYKLLFDIFIPIFRTTRKVQAQFRHMQDQMNGQTQQAAKPQAQARASQAGSGTSSKPPPSRDYIEFEEIK